MSVSKTILVVLCRIRPLTVPGFIWVLFCSFFAGWRVVLVAYNWQQEILKANGAPSIDLPIDLEVHIFERSSRWSAAKDPQTVPCPKIQKLIDHHRPQVVWCNYADLVPIASPQLTRCSALVPSPRFWSCAQLKMIETRPWRTGWGSAICSRPCWSRQT